MVDQLTPPTERTHTGPPAPRFDPPAAPITSPALSLDGIVADDEASREQPGLKHRAVWTFADQGISSATNVLLSLLIGHVAGVDGFGAFALAFSVFSFVIGISRATVSDPLMIRFSAVSPAELRSAIRQASGAATTLGMVAGVVTGLAGLAVRTWLDPAIGDAVVAVAIVLPALLLQDAWRFAFFVQGRPERAALNDGVWAVAQFAGIGALIVSGHTSVFLLTVAWGASAALAALVGCLQLRAVPQPSAAGTWFRTHRRLSVQMGADYVINMAAVNITFVVVAAFGGKPATAALRAAQVLLGPLQLAFAGLSAFVLPVFSRRATGGRSLFRPVMLVSVVLASTATVWTAVLLLLPDSVGVLIFDANWAGASRVMLASGASIIAIATAVGPALGLKAFGRADLGLKVSAVQAPAILLLGSIGASMNGAQGAAIGLAIAQTVGVLLCWVLFTHAQREANRIAVPLFARHARSYDRWAWAVGTSTPRHGPTVRGVVVPTRPAQAAGRHVLRREPR